ncbi:uncharacterized protein V6R79_017936 [Siganus canaliculatus]
MEQFIFLLVALVRVTHGFLQVPDTKCNAIRNSSLCSATLGGIVEIQIMTNASGYHLRCKKHLPSGPINVFSLKKEKVTVQQELRNRTEFSISNGTLKIADVQWSDAGEYHVEIFTPHGKYVDNIYINLEIQEHTTPLVIIVCSAVAVVVVLVCVCGCVFWKRKCKRKQVK